MDSFKKPYNYENEVESQTPSSSSPSPSLTTLSNEQTCIQESLNLIHHSLQANVSLWIGENLCLSNLKDFETRIFPQLFENALDEERQKLPNGVIKAVMIQRVEDEWRPQISTIMKAASFYGNKLATRLDIRRHLSPEDFHKYSDHLLITYLKRATNIFTETMIQKACDKIKCDLKIRNEWVLKNKSRINAKVKQIKRKYRQEVDFLTTADQNVDILKFHAQLKAKLVHQFKMEIRIPDNVNKNVLFDYITQLYGELNAEYDDFILKKIGLEEFGESFQELLTPPTKSQVDDHVEAHTKETKENYPHSSLPNKNEGRRYKNDWQVAKGSERKVGNSNIFYFEDNFLSTGASAIVYRGRFVDTMDKHHKVAVKRFPRTNEKQFENELKNWKEIYDTNSAESLHVARLLAHHKWDGDLFLAIELAEMDLERKISTMKKQFKSAISPGSPPFLKLAKYIQDASKGLYWLHRKNIIHRDIKPANILIFSSHLNGESHETAKITDFGISRMVRDSGVAKTKADGTDDWNAPEVLEAKKRGGLFENTKAQDIFSMGLTVHYTLSLGKHPFSYSKRHNHMIFLNILDKKNSATKLPFPHFVANDLVEAMISRNPNDRPEISTVLKHPLFWEVKKSLDFLTNFARVVGEKDPNSIEFRNTVDKKYLEFYEQFLQADHGNEDEGKENNTKCFDWERKMGEEMFKAIMERKNNSWQGRYDSNSVMSLVKLIRDKYWHSEDLDDKLTTEERFGKDELFNGQKYGEYFLELFPDVLIFLKNIAFSCINEFPKLKQLHETFFDIL